MFSGANTLGGVSTIIQKKNYNFGIQTCSFNKLGKIKSASEKKSTILMSQRRKVTKLMGKKSNIRYHRQLTVQLKFLDKSTHLSSNYKIVLYQLFQKILIFHLYTLNFWRSAFPFVQYWLQRTCSWAPDSKYKIYNLRF